MFLPSDQVVIAIENSKTCFDIFKEFKSTNPNDKFEMEAINIGNRSINVIHSDQLYEYFHTYLDEKFDDVKAACLKGLVGKTSKMKLYYVTPKELLKLMPASNISMFNYQGSYFFSLINSSGEIVTLIQAIKPVVGVDHHLFDYVFKSLLKDSIRYVFKNQNILKDNIKNETIKHYLVKTTEWYRAFIENIIDRYNLISQVKSNSRDVTIDALTNQLLNIVAEGSRKGKVETNAILDFFKVTMLRSTDVLKKFDINQDTNKIQKLEDVNIEDNLNNAKRYLKEIYTPFKKIFKNMIFQPEVLIVNQEFQNILEIIYKSYDAIFEQSIDVNFYIRGTILQELYHFHTIAVNYHMFKEDDELILDALISGDIFELQNNFGYKKPLRVKRIRKVCLEVSGLTPTAMKNGNYGDIEEIELSEDGDLLKTGYTSNYVKNIIKDQVMRQNKKFEVIQDSLIRLIDNGVITPVMFTDSESFNILATQSNNYQYEKRIMGFYENERNRIFLLLNNVSVGGMGSACNSGIISLILHELMHYAYQNLINDYMVIFNTYIQTFYSDFFNHYYKMDIPKDQVEKYVKSLYKLEKNGKAGDMIDNLNDILEYAQEKGDKNLAYMNSKAFEKLFMYLSEPLKNDTGAKIAQLSKSFFTESMLVAYEKTFCSMNKEIAQRYLTQNDSVKFNSVFYQEFIATSEVAAMLAGTLVRELYKQQITLQEDHPIAKMINTL